MTAVLNKDKFIPSGEKIVVQQNYLGCDLHSHEFLELVFVQSGHAKHEVGEFSQVVSVGDSFLIDLGSSHAFIDASEDFTVINCLFLPSFLSSVTADDCAFKALAGNVFLSITANDIPSYLFVKSGNASGIGALFLQMLDEYRSKRTAHLEVLQSLLKVLLITMFRSCGGEQTPKIIGDVIEYIKKSSDKKVRLEELSEAMFFSPAYISRIFKKHTGRNLTDFIRETRMQSVCDSLIFGKDSVDSVMQAHGYSDKKSFYEHFKAIYGCTPAQYRAYNAKK